MLSEIADFFAPARPNIMGVVIGSSLTLFSQAITTWRTKKMERKSLAFQMMLNYISATHAGDGLRHIAHLSKIAMDVMESTVKKIDSDIHFDPSELLELLIKGEPKSKLEAINIAGAEYRHIAIWVYYCIKIQKDKDNSQDIADKVVSMFDNSLHNFNKTLRIPEVILGKLPNKTMEHHHRVFQSLSHIEQHLKLLQTDIREFGLREEQTPLFVASWRLIERFEENARHLCKELASIANITDKELEQLRTMEKAFHQWENGLVGYLSTTRMAMKARETSGNTDGSSADPPPPSPNLL